MAVRSVLNGRYAEASVGGVLIALLTEWEVIVTTDDADTTAHGDYWQQHAVLDSGWTFRAKGYVVPGSAAHYINSLYSSATGAATAVLVAGFSGALAGTKIFEGTGTVTRGTLSAPMELATQEFEIKGNGAPAVGV